MFLWIVEMSDTGYSPSVMEGRQIRAARAMLGLSQGDLCEAAGISRATLIDLEKETGDPRRSSLEAVEEAFRKKGVIFTDDGKTVGVFAPKKR
jgi:DNA-binding XRE family transcriptional regulator